MSARDLSLFIGRRVLALALLLLVISFGVFSLLYLAPGSPVDVLLGSRPASPATVRALRAQYHLDQPFLAQYSFWLRHALTGDFGRSIRTSEPVVSVIRQRTGVTVFLGLYAFVIAAILGVVLGVVAAVRKRTALDRCIVALTVIGVSAPPFATGLFMLYVFAVTLGWFPVFGLGTGFVDELWHLALPACALSLVGMALILKITRAAMIGTLDADYVAFARARGLGLRRILRTHALRNASVPIVTAGSNILAVMLTGAVLVEITFALPGGGALLVESVTYKDIPVIQGLVLMLAILIVVVNLVTDVLYVVIDPRIRLGGRAT